MCVCKLNFKSLDFVNLILIRSELTLTCFMLRNINVKSNFAMMNVVWIILINKNHFTLIVAKNDMNIFHRLN